jgi:ribonuclease P protein component
VTFPKILRLLTRKEFLRVSARHKRLHGNFLVIEMHRKREGETRLGITVTKRFGNAPQRNRFKRLVREAFRHHRSELPPGLDLVVRPRSAALDATYEQVASEILQLLKLT